MAFITSILIVAACYLLAGFIFALFFVTRGVGKIDEGAAGAGWGFRLIIIPGTVLFWPLLWKKWRRSLKNTVSPGNTDQL